MIINVYVSFVRFLAPSSRLLEVASLVAMPTRDMLDACKEDRALARWPMIVWNWQSQWPMFVKQMVVGFALDQDTINLLTHRLWKLL